MRPTGFSTGALAKGDFQTALKWLEATDTDAIELSALREEELPELLQAIDGLNLGRFCYKSIHAPKEFGRLSEHEAVDMLLPFAKKGFRIILHPDAIHDPKAWTTLGDALCIENMDMRKRTGRTVRELRSIFEQLPESKLCLDLGHARQVDPSMAVAFHLMHAFGDRLEEIHASEVDTGGNHVRMSRPCIEAFNQLSRHIKDNVAIIIESQVLQDGLNDEIASTRELFSDK